MRVLALLFITLVLGCTAEQLESGRQFSSTLQGGASTAGSVATNPAVVAATGGASLPIGEVLMGVATGAWAAERFFAWRLKLKANEKPGDA